MSDARDFKLLARIAVKASRLVEEWNQQEPNPDYPITADLESLLLELEWLLVDLPQALKERIGL